MRAAWLCLVALGCGGGDDPPADAGNTGVPGTYTVSGVISYEDRPPLETGALGAITPVVARGISVALVAETGGEMLAMGVTGDDGRYALTADGVGGDSVHVLAVASSTDTTRPIQVRRADNNQIHGFGGADFGLDTITHDVLITVDSGAAGAFNVFDQLVTTMDRIRSIYGTQTPTPLRAFWHAGNGDGTYYSGNEMYLLGEESDDDGFDDTVILHEAGHYVEDAYGRSDSPGGSHDGSPADPRLAWSEGFSTYFAMAIRNQPVYMDSNADGGWSYNAETSVFRANPNGPIGQQVSEDMIAEILWDMGDPADDDTLAGSHEPVLSVQSYVKTAALRQVGQGGMDLVDALDGWFVENGLASCAAMRAIVNTAHTFPYDYGGPAGACP
jgi:hypothetical protein